MKRLFAVASLALISCACASRGPTPLTTSLLGAPLAAPERSAPTERWLQLEIDAATAKWHLAPSETSAIWVGRRLAYKSMFPEAIAWYEGAIETYPESYRLRRHVGHRMLTLRRIDAAVEILTAARELAAQHPNRLEPDGAPGPSGEPRSTTHGNIDYHLALAHYLRGEFDRAAELWSLCLTRWSRNDDSRVAAMHWLYTTLVRAGRAGEAILVLETPIDPEDVIENFAYHELVELYRGDLALADLMARDERSAALDYGIARHLLARGDAERGNAMLDDLLLREGWAAFGVLAAEADVARRDGVAAAPE